MGLPWWFSGQEPTCNARVTGDVGSIPGLGRSPGGGHSTPLQYFYLVISTGPQQVFNRLQSFRPLSHKLRGEYEAPALGASVGVRLLLETERKKCKRAAAGDDSLLIRQMQGA